MFVLANRVVLEKDPGNCWFSGRITSAVGDNAPVLKWCLRLHSRLGQVPDGEPVSLGVNCAQLELKFDVADWCELMDRTFELTVEPGNCGIYVIQWEDLHELRIRFGAVCGSEIEVLLEGAGALESAPEIFGDVVEFKIDTSVLFSGVYVDVPLNSPDPVSYAKAHLGRLLPQFRHAEPKVIEGWHEARLHQWTVHFEPVKGSCGTNSSVGRER